MIDLLVVCIAALLQPLSLSWPFHTGLNYGQATWQLQFVSLILLAGFLQYRVITARQTAAWTSFYALISLTGTFWWLFISMHTYGGLSGVLAAGAVLFLGAALSIFYGSSFYLFGWLRNQTLALHPQVLCAAFAGLWCFSEMARGVWLTGFGWGASGYAHIEGPFSFYLPWIGSYGVGALVAWSAYAVVLIPRTVKPFVIAMALLLVGFLTPDEWNNWTQCHNPLSVALLQGNIPQEEKFETGTGVVQSLDWYGAKLRESRADLTVAPETAFPVLPAELPDGYLQTTSNQYINGSQAALVGMPLGSFSNGYTNSVQGWTPFTRNWHYDKHHLVPFGEFIPTGFKWFTRLMHIPLGDFNRGSIGQASLEWKGQRLGVNICYEDLYGEELAARFSNASEAPTLLVNVSNIGWFGDSIAIEQHLNISRARAIEFQRPLVRATNTGATAIIDQHGKVTALLPRLTAGVLTGSVEGCDGLTPYAWWASRFGLWPLWIVVASVIALVYFQGQRRRAQAS